MNKINIKKVTYKYLAKEYYDNVLHPTCANFRTSSKLLIKGIIESSSIGRIKNALEIGAGKSILVELLGEIDIDLENLIVSDKEENMLQYSEPLIKVERHKLKKVNAEDTGFENNSFDLIISSLGDPYNTTKLWFEISRILSPNGLFIFTTPSFEWSKDFRKNSNHQNYAEFLTSINEIVRVPSYIYEFEKQKLLIEEANLTILKYENISSSHLKGTEISPKLLSDRKHGLPIVSLYLIMKKKHESTT